MKVTVYLGANMGDNPSFKKATIALGQWIAKNGLRSDSVPPLPVPVHDGL